MADIQTNTTMKEFTTNDKAYYYSGIASIMVNGKRAYELKGKFLDDLHDNAFSETNGEDASEQMVKKDVDDEEFSAVEDS
ncbi:hypothetical protein Tco_0370383 [Tanacetum coccineum]